MTARPTRPVIRPVVGPREFPTLVQIWRSAVLATHDFLDEADFVRIERALPEQFFPAVTLLVADIDGRAVGFAGVADGALEMLFVDDAHRGTGVGSALLDQVVTRHGVTRVDVNEQNPQAVGFYLHHGFTRTGRSATDAEGRPYPILHLTRTAG